MVEVLGNVLEVDLGELPAGPEALEKHVEHGGEDVAVLGVGQVVQEGKHYEHVKPPEKLLPENRAVPAHAVVEGRKRPGDGKHAGAGLRERDSRSRGEKGGYHEPEDETQYDDRVGTVDLPSPSYGEPVDYAHAYGDEHQRLHDVQHELVNPVRRPGKELEAGNHAADQHLHGSDGYDEKAPEDHRVLHAREPVLEKPLLPEDVDEDLSYPLGDVVEPVVGPLAQRDQPEKKNDVVGEKTERAHEQNEHYDGLWTHLSPDRTPWKKPDRLY